MPRSRPHTAQRPRNCEIRDGEDSIFGWMNMFQFVRICYVFATYLCVKWFRICIHMTSQKECASHKIGGCARIAEGAQYWCKAHPGQAMVKMVPREGIIATSLQFDPPFNPLANSVNVAERNVTRQFFLGTLLDIWCFNHFWDASWMEHGMDEWSCRVFF